jgi:hypothetical protein
MKKVDWRAAALQPTTLFLTLQQRCLATMTCAQIRTSNSYVWRRLGKFIGIWLLINRPFTPIITGKWPFWLGCPKARKVSQWWPVCLRAIPLLRVTVLNLLSVNHCCDVRKDINDGIRQERASVVFPLVKNRHDLLSHMSNWFNLTISSAIKSKLMLFQHSLNYFRVSHPENRSWWHHYFVLAEHSCL